MTDQRSPLATYRPDTDYRDRPAGTAPKPTPGFRETVGASFTVAGADRPGDDEQAVINAYGPLVSELSRRGYPVSRYVFASRGAGQPVNEYALWRDLAAEKARDPQAFAGVAADRKAFRAKALADYRAQLERDTDIADRGGLLGNLVGGLGAAATDPINVGTAFVSGGGSTLARRVAGEALANAGVELLQQPLVAMQRGKTGRSLTIGEAAANVALAGTLGGAVPLVGAGARRIVTPAGRMAQEMLARIGRDRMTPEERAAVRTLQTEDDVLQSSPFTPGAGSDAHLRRIAAEKSAIAGGRPIASSMEATYHAKQAAEKAARFDYHGWSGRVGRAESGGRWQIGASTSSAYGLYQITRGTFVRVAKDLPSFAHMSDEAIWNARTNPASQEAVFGALTRQYRAALTRAGVPESFGNLYLMHFAGLGGGAKILKAAPDTPIERLLSEKAIEANPWLRGKTADDMIAWSHAKMGETPHDGPVLSRAGYSDDADGDAAWLAAQAEVDAATRAMDAADAELARASALPSVRDADDAIPFDLDDPRARDMAGADPFGGVEDGAAEPSFRVVDEVDDGVGPVAMAAEREPDATTFTTAKGSSYRVEESGATTRDKAYRPEHGVAEQGLMPTSDRTFYVDPAHVEPLGLIQTQGGKGRMAVIVNDAGTHAAVQYVDGPEAGKIISGTVVPIETRPRMGALPVELWRGGERVHFGNEIVALRERVERPKPIAREDVERAESTIADQFADGPEPQPVPARLEGYEDAADRGAVEALDSLEHDLRMLMDAEPGALALDENGDVVSLSDLMAGWDIEEGEVAAMHACLTPGGAE